MVSWVIDRTTLQKPVQTFLSNDHHCVLWDNRVALNCQKDLFRRSFLVICWMWWAWYYIPKNSPLTIHQGQGSRWGRWTKLTDIPHFPNTSFVPLLSMLCSSIKVSPSHVIMLWFDISPSHVRIGWFAATWVAWLYTRTEILRMYRDKF